MSDNHGNVEYFYSNHYSELIGNRSSGLLSFLWKYPHKLLEEGHSSSEKLDILELGAGEGEHISFVLPNFRTYLMTDIDEARLKRFDQQNQDPRVAIQRTDATRLPFEDNRFDRVIVTCLLIHLNNPEQALKEWRRVTKPGGVIDIYLPCEPGLALRLFRMLVTKPKAVKSGFTGYDLFMARDHLTSTQRLLELISFVYLEDEIKSKYRPFIIPSWYLNLFITLRIRIR